MKCMYVTDRIFRSLLFRLFWTGEKTGEKEVLNYFLQWNNRQLQLDQARRQAVTDSVSS